MVAGKMVYLENGVPTGFVEEEAPPEVVYGYNAGPPPKNTTNPSFSY